MKRTHPGPTAAVWLVCSFLLLALTAPSARAETLTLEDCLRETALHSPAVVQQTREIERAAGTRLTLRSRALPTLSISGLAGQRGQETQADLLEPVPSPAPGQPTQVRIIEKRPSQYLVIGSGGLSQPIFDAAIPASWRRATLETAAAQQNYYSTAVTQLHLTRTLFYQALYYRENGALLAEIDKGYAANTKTVETLVNSGLVARQALLQSQTVRANLSSSIIGANGSYRTTLTSLLAAMGREQRRTGNADPLASVQLDGALDDGPFHFDPRVAAERALAHRPDLEALRVLSRTSREDARITRAGYYPLVRVYVTGDVLPQSVQRSGQPNALRAADNQQTTEVRPGARYDWNVLDTGSVAGAAQQIDRTREGVEINLKHLEQDIPADLAQLRAALDAAASTLDALRDNLTAAQDTLNIVTAAVAQGTGSQLEFSDAQTALLTTRSSQLQARLQASTSRAEYDRVTGGYLRFVAAGPEGIESNARPVK